MQDAEKQFAKTRSEADKLKLETAQADYDNMVRNLKPVTKGAGDTEKAISKIEDTATGSSNAFSGIVGAIAQTGITKLVGDVALDARKIPKVIGAEHIQFHDLRYAFAALSLKNRRWT